MSDANSRIAFCLKTKQKWFLSKQMPLFSCTPICASYRKFTAVKASNDMFCWQTILQCATLVITLNVTTISDLSLTGPYRTVKMLMWHGNGAGLRSWTSRWRRTRFLSMFHCSSCAWIVIIEGELWFVLVIHRIRLRNSKKKKKLVAWYVARCGSKSKREAYINELRVSFWPHFFKDKDMGRLKISFLPVDRNT